MLAEEGRESAREFLREIVAGLAEPAPGGEAARVAFLLGLDAIAQDLGSLQELSTVRRSVMEIRTRLLPPDHPDLLASKQDFAKTRYELGDIEGAHELFEAVLETMAERDVVMLRTLVDRKEADLASFLRAVGFQDAPLQALEMRVHAEQRRQGKP